MVEDVKAPIPTRRPHKFLFPDAGGFPFGSRKRNRVQNLAFCGLREAPKGLRPGL